MHPRVDRNVFVLAVVVVLVVGLATENQRQRARHESSLGNWVVALLVRPLQWSLERVGDAVGSVIGTVREIGHLHSENQRLRRENERLRRQVHLYTEMVHENERLKRMLAYRSRLLQWGEGAVLAPVIGMNPTNWFDTLLIGAGTRQGVREKQIVLTDRGLVGQVRLATTFEATVLLITDLNSGVGGCIQRTGWNGVVRGTSGPMLQMVYLPKEADVRRGDVVVTNGLGTVFQVRGVPIGTVQRVDLDANTSAKTAEVLPAVDFRRLEEVFVLQR